MFSELQAPCPRCGKPRAEWIEESGEGVVFGAQTYCSHACAEQDTRPDSQLEREPEQQAVPAVPSKSEGR